MSRQWNHNTQYHAFVLGCVPQGCRRALDVGCGHGLLARRLAARCEAVVGIETDGSVAEAAAEASLACPNLSILAGDAVTYPFAAASFDLITAVAVLHHLPLRLALLRFRGLLQPGGVLVVVGLYRQATLGDAVAAAVGLPASWIMRRLRPEAPLAVPMKAPGGTLSDIGSAARELLPGAIVRRRLFFRYTLTWRKPIQEEASAD